MVKMGRGQSVPWSWWRGGGGLDTGVGVCDARKITLLFVFSLFFLS